MEKESFSSYLCFDACASFIMSLSFTFVFFFHILLDRQARVIFRFAVRAAGGVRDLVVDGPELAGKSPLPW